jgi:hypothetical protein
MLDHFGKIWRDVAAKAMQHERALQRYTGVASSKALSNETR